jgi:spermidine synthase
MSFVLASLPVIAAVNFLLVLGPALLMGATFPILVAHTVRQWGNVGMATGHLYGANTLGAALGALSTVFGLFHVMRLDQSISLAAALNFSVVAVGFWRLRQAR